HIAFSCTTFLSQAPPTTPLYTLSLHDALPISPYSSLKRELSSSKARISTTSGLGSAVSRRSSFPSSAAKSDYWMVNRSNSPIWRSEEHTSELQSRGHLVCRLLLEKKKKTQQRH